MRAVAGEALRMEVSAARCLRDTQLIWAVCRLSSEKIRRSPEGKMPAVAVYRLQHQKLKSSAPAHL